MALCEECGGAMVIKDFQRYCQECGLVDSHYDACEISYNTNYSVKPTYKPKDNFQAVLNRLQGSCSSVCARFDKKYIDQLQSKLKNDHSLANIHKNVPNKDQRYINCIYSELTGKSLFIEYNHRELLRMMFNRCYEKYLQLEGKRPCVLNILQVAVDYYKLDYIKPFIYTKFKLSTDIYNQLYHAWDA